MSSENPSAVPSGIVGLKSMLFLGAFGGALGVALANAHIAGTSLTLHWNMNRETRESTVAFTCLPVSLIIGMLCGGFGVLVQGLARRVGIRAPAVKILVGCIVVLLGAVVSYVANLSFAAL